MDVLNRLERRFGRLGIPGLIRYVVFGRALAFLLALARPDYPGFLVLDPEAVRRGELWRLVTYVLMPPESDMLFAAISLMFLWWAGGALEATWGPFRLTLYYLLGALGTAVANAVVLGAPATPFYLDLSLLLALASLYPDATIFLMLIIPLRIKWLGLFLGGTLLVQMVLLPPAGKLALGMALSNYLLFFGPALLRRTAAAAGPAAAPQAMSHAAAAPLAHRCAACGRTERDDRELEFRICACHRCGEGREYCLEHLKEHLTLRDADRRSDRGDDQG